MRAETKVSVFSDLEKRIITLETEKKSLIRDRELLKEKLKDVEEQLDTEHKRGEQDGISREMF